MNRLVFVNGSLCGASSSSLAFLKAVETRLGEGVAEIRHLAVSTRPDGGFSTEALGYLAEADAICRRVQEMNLTKKMPDRERDDEI